MEKRLYPPVIQNIILVFDLGVTCYTEAAHM